MTGDDRKTYFSSCIEASIDALYGVAVRLVGRGSDAEDLVAETVARAWGAYDSLEDPDRFRPWLFRILHNCFVSDYRKRSVRPAETPFIEEADDEDGGSLCTLLNAQPDEFLAWWSNPERAFFNDLLGEQLTTALDALPEAFRTAVILVNVEGFTYDEAAEVLGVPTGTIRSRMKRGRTLLQKALWEQAQSAGLAACKDI